MRTLRFTQLYPIIILLLSTFTAAWPWPNWLPEFNALVVREDSNSTSTSSAAASSTGTSSPKETGKSDSDSDSDSDNKNSTSTSATKTKIFGVTVPAGGIEMQTPDVYSGEQYYKIGDHVTFVWNYTSLSVTPTAIDVMATCTANSQLYTIAVNQTVGNATGAVTWDTGAYQFTAVSDPLLTETYTLIIYDAESSISAAAKPGYLQVFDQYTFGMYEPQPYTPLADFQCATCSGALSDVERRAVGMVIGVGVVTVLSFTWFVGGTGIIW